MSTIKELVERREQARAALAEIEAEIAARHGETDPDPAEAEEPTAEPTEEPTEEA